MISTIILFLGALALVVWGGIPGRNDERHAGRGDRATPQQYVAGRRRARRHGCRRPRRGARPSSRSGDVDAAIVGDSSSPLGFAVIADVERADAAAAAARRSCRRSSCSTPTTTDAALRYLVAIGFGIVFLLAASLFGGTIAQSVVEEKQTRVVELLISAIPVRSLLAGKVIGNTVLAMGQILDPRRRSRSSGSR